MSRTESASAGPRWTDAQLRGIRTQGRSLLVSAAAGSGKTAMLSERCAYLVCDLPEETRCDVDELLVVTFTEAAATQMRQRIQSALAKRRQNDPSDRMARQMVLVDQAAISTLHGFCARLLRQHFHLVGLDPGFTVMDGDEAKLLRIEIARELLENEYEFDNDGDFQRLVDAAADGNDERLADDLITTHEMLQSLVDPREWIDRTTRDISEAAHAPLAESVYGRELIELIRERLGVLRSRCRNSIELLRRMKGFPQYLALLRDIEQAIAHWQRVAQEEGLDTLASEVAQTPLPGSPASPTTPRASRSPSRPSNR